MRRGGGGRDGIFGGVASVAVLSRVPEHAAEKPMLPLFLEL
jgi:hypothetical protein